MCLRPVLPTKGSVPTVFVLFLTSLSRFDSFVRCTKCRPSLASRMARNNYRLPYRWLILTCENICTRKVKNSTRYLSACDIKGEDRRIARQLKMLQFAELKTLLPPTRCGSCHTRGLFASYGRPFFAFPVKRPNPSVPRQPDRFY